MDLNPAAQKAIVKILGADCFNNIDFSENICLSTKFTLLVDSLTEYEYAFEHTIDRSEKSLYEKLDASVQTDGADFIDKETQTDEGDFKVSVSKSEKETFVEVKVETEDDDNSVETAEEIKDPEEITQVMPQSPVSPASPGPQRRLRSNKPEDVSCPLCPAKFSEKDSAEQHLKITHDIGNFYVCSICQHICNSKGALVEHIKENHEGTIQQEVVTRKRGRPRKTEPKKLPEVSDEEETEKKSTTAAKKTSKQSKKKTKTKQKSKKAKKLLKVEEDYDAETDVEGEEKETKTPPLRKAISDPKYVPKDGNTCKCIDCGKEYKSRRALRRHYASHHEKGGQDYQCEICGKSFTSKDSLYHHRRGVHQNLKVYKCPEPDCDATFNFNHSLRLHKLKHTGTRPHMCSQCGKTYLTAYHLKVHVMATHAAKSFSCSVCGKMFSYSTSLKMHEATHQKQQRVNCDQCAKTFVNLQALKYHIMSKHTEPGNYTCDECGKVCKTEFLLRAHKKRHSVEGSRFMCDVCGRQFMYKSALEMHRAIHREDKQYTCKICDKSFKTYPTLYSHQYVHKEDSPYCCTQCGKAFKTKERCKAHEKRHSGLKPYECGICHHCFPDNGGLSKHLRTVHCTVKKFVCDICGKATSRADNLRVHMKVHSKGDIGNSKPYKRNEAKNARNAYNLPSMVPLTFEHEDVYAGKKEKAEYFQENSNESVNPSPVPHHTTRDDYPGPDVYQPNMPNFSTLDTSQLSSHSEDQILPLNLHNQTAPSQNSSANSYQPLTQMNSHNNTAVSLSLENSVRNTSAPPSLPSSSSGSNITVTTLQSPHLHAMYTWPYVYPALPPQGSGGSNGYFQQ